MSAAGLTDDDPHLALILGFYGERRAKRSGVLLTAHVHEGLRILDALRATLEARRAYCLHPIVQSDEDLVRAVAPGGLLRVTPGLDPVAVAFALEYRSVANAFLSTREVASVEEIRLSPIPDVNLLLIADKVQNRKDFERHHRETHPRARELERYFDLWLRRLGVSDERARELERIAEAGERVAPGNPPVGRLGP